ncbi:DUF871 domain-containing protein [Erysipelothrix sp. HDW6C]|uniref:DUF871 domain-containing protein n=1 Tax=Erysipelothrix sp. HDW6C TaxID=2714930 RepID=UPI0014089BC4|nr:MupG family TIM beta-alpha barrel fold protein [Erysipelothrix sp. HDW6C]QIK69818.1 DUF871 domain-containing protein [Erysipelothrix sp. HDW6C]
MRKLGISIYPDKSTVEEMKAYIVKAADAGFSRIFSCLLSVEKPREEIKAEFIDINTFAKEYGFEIIVDVSPKVFKDLEISYDDLTFFHEIGADGIRLDAGFGGAQEAMMTFNEFDLKIEINMSNDTNYIDTIMDFQPNQYNLIACHNFYPHPYSGLTEEHFVNCTTRFTKYGLRSAAFVASMNPEAYGPWPVDYGLVTLESHRGLPMHVQIKDYIARNILDDIIVSNFVPSDAELEEVKKINLTKLNLAVELVDGIPELMKKIVLEEPHFNRGDVSDYLLRSTMSRVKYKGQGFPVFNAPEMIKRGDIVIESDDFGHYAGELNIAKKDMKNTGKSNVVGHVVAEEIFLLDKIKPWQKFEFTL